MTIVELAAKVRNDIPFNKQRELAIGLLACASFRNPGTRGNIISNLRSDIADAIPRGSIGRDEALNVVTTCLNYDKGLSELIDVLEFYEGAALQMQALFEILWDVVHPVTLARQMRAQVLEIISDDDINKEDLEKIYTVSFPQGYEQRPEAADLADALRQLSLITVEVEGVFRYPVIEFIQRLANPARSKIGGNTIQPLPANITNRLRACLADIMGRLNISPTVFQDDDPAPTQGPYLLIEIKESDLPTDQEESYCVQSWLWRNPDDIVFLDTHESLDRKAVMQVVNNQVKSASKTLKGKSELVVEFFLPRELLHWDVDQWEVLVRSRTAMTLGYECQVVVRSIDRALDENIRRFWQLKWSQLQSQAPQFLWVCKEEEDANQSDQIWWICREGMKYNSKFLLAKLSAPNVVGPALTFAPRELPDLEKGDLLYTSFDAGTPIALWFRQSHKNIEEIQKEIDDYLSMNGCKGLPEFVKDKRNDLTSFGNSLTLLYDNPERLPPYAEQLEAPRKEKNTL